MSKCAKCGGTFFELKEQSPEGSAFKLNFIQCSKCGSPVGVMDYFDIHSGIAALRDRLDRIEGSLSDLDYKLRSILQNQKR